MKSPLLPWERRGRQVVPARQELGAERGRSVFEGAMRTLGKRSLRREEGCGRAAVRPGEPTATGRGTRGAGASRRPWNSGDFSPRPRGPGPPARQSLPAVTVPNPMLLPAQLLTSGTLDRSLTLPSSLVDWARSYHAPASQGGEDPAQCGSPRACLRPLVSTPQGPACARSGTGWCQNPEQV